MSSKSISSPDKFVVRRQYLSTDRIRPTQTRAEVVQIASTSATHPDMKMSHTRISSTVVAVVGVGYVGEHLVLEFSKHYPTIAYDIDARRLDQISQHKTKHQLMTTRNPDDLHMATHILIAVPTGVFHDGTINTNILRNAVDIVIQHARIGATVVVESSVAVGMTRDLFGNAYLEKRLKVGMSPEVSVVLSAQYDSNVADIR